MLEIRELDSGYGYIQILWGASLRAGKGSIVVVLGPNGAGKTTLMNTIMGFVKPWRGKIFFKNIDVTRKTPHEKVNLGLNIVPEGRRLFTNMTVKENLILGAYTKRARERISDSLELVYNLFPVLKERSYQIAGTLSGGEQQMLAIARVLMSRPEMILLDEPSQGIAPKVVDDIMRVLSKLRDEEKISILLVEQNIQVALDYGDYFYVMDQGRIVAEGGSEEIVKNTPESIRSLIGL